MAPDEVDAILNFHFDNKLYPFAILAELHFFSDDPERAIIYDITSDLEYGEQWRNPAAGRFVRIYCVT
jgi:hypothetical protein